MKNSPTVAHFVLDFLNLSESWIYNQIKHDQLKNLVICRNRYHADQFPCSNLHTYPRWSNHFKSSLFKKSASMTQRLINLNSGHESNFYNKTLAKQKGKRTTALKKQASTNRQVPPPYNSSQS